MLIISSYIAIRPTHDTRSMQEVSIHNIEMCIRLNHMFSVSSDCMLCINNFLNLILPIINYILCRMLSE